MWTQERSDLCVTLWRQGLSARQIAYRLGEVSRNGVIGRMHRLGEPKRSFASRSATSKLNATGPKPRKPKRERSDGQMFAPTFAREPLPPEPPRPKKLFTLDSLTDSQCRFPYGDPKSAEFGFCGCKKMARSSYCPGHHGKVWRGVPERKSDPIRVITSRVRNGAGYQTLKEVMS